MKFTPVFQEPFDIMKHENDIHILRQLSLGSQLWCPSDKAPDDNSVTFTSFRNNTLMDMITTPTQNSSSSCTIIVVSALEAPLRPLYFT